jgi:hypothetical protein
MGHALARDRLLARALLVSLGLHLVLLALIPPLATLEGQQSVELLSFVHALPIRIESTRARPQIPHAQRLAAAPVRPVVRSIGRSAPRVHARAGAPHLGVAQTGSVSANAGATALPAQASTPQPSASVAPNQAQVGAVMPLGAEEPMPVLDPAVRGALVALGVHVTITVDVDADGHTQRIAFAPQLDEDVESRIRTLLASASWDPAVCGGGVTCAGQAVIRL